MCAYAVAQTPAAIDAMMEAGHWKQVRQIASARVASNPNDAQARAWLAKAKITFGDFDGAIADAERALASEPKNPNYLAPLAEANANAADHSSAIRGYAYVRAMKKAIEASLAVDPKHIDTMLVEMMFAWKAPTIAGGDKKKARRIADTIQSISPQWGYLAHARLLQDSGDDATVEPLLLNAVKAAPGFYRSRVALARFYCCTARTKHLDLAEKAAKEAIALDPNAPAGYELLARVYAASQRWADLEATIARADTAAPEDRIAYYAAALSLIDIGQDFRRAEKYLAHYLSQPVEGREPTAAEARWLLATMYEHEGRKSDAVRELLAAVKLEPGFEQARRDLKRLQRA